MAYTQENFERVEYIQENFERESRKFENLFNIFNHKINLFQLNEENIEKNNKLKLDIQNINEKLSSVYSSNTFAKKEKIVINNYQMQEISTNPIKIVIPLNRQYLAA